MNHKESVTIPGAEHYYVNLNGTELHYVSAGTVGSPVLLVHGFPETWWVFNKLIPLLSKYHQVFPLDCEKAFAMGAKFAKEKSLRTK